MVFLSFLFYFIFFSLFVLCFGKMFLSNCSIELKKCHNFKFQELFTPQIFLCNGNFLFNEFYLVSPKIIITLDCYFLPKRRKYGVIDLAGSAAKPGAAGGAWGSSLQNGFLALSFSLADLRI